MIGHYIEDDALDAFSLMGLINGESNLAMTTSKSLKGFCDWVTPKDVDFILLDINRPDTRSLEKDVQIIRESSKAPIIFITGDEAQYYREEAVLAGAQAVIEKDNLTVSSLVEVLKSVVMERPGIADEDADEHHLIAAQNSVSSSTIDTDKVEIAFSYLQEAIGCLANANTSKPGDAELQRSGLKMLAGAAASLRTFYAIANEGHRGGASGRALPVIIRSIQEASLSAAKQKETHLVFQMGVDVLQGLTRLGKIQLGIRHFVHSAIVGSPAGNTLAFSANPAPDGVRLALSSHEMFAFDLSKALDRQVPTELIDFAPTVALTLALMLLDADRSSITNFSRGSLHSIIIETSGKSAEV